MYAVGHGKSEVSMIGSDAKSETKRSSQVAEQLIIQEKLITEMTAALDNLSAILTVVTRFVPRPEEALKEQVALVPLAEKIKSNNSMITEHISRIGHIINTIEL